MEKAHVYYINVSDSVYCFLCFVYRGCYRMKYLRKFKQDYRHIICAVITVLSLALGILFPNSLPRIAEALRDLLFSLGFYVVEIFTRGENPITVTVTEPQSWIFAEQIWEPIKIFPESWEEFTMLWGNYWELFFSPENFKRFISRWRHNSWRWWQISRIFGQ